MVETVKKIFGMTEVISDHDDEIKGEKNWR